MNRWAFTAFAVLLWVVPALVAGALGWPGGADGGYAFRELIIPAPGSGGILHVPSFVVALAIVKAYPTFTEQSATVARAVLISALVLGLLQLLDLERFVQIITTDVGGRAFRMEQSYIGLCMASDAIVTLAWVLRQPREKTSWVLTSLIVVVPAALYVGSDAAGLGGLQEPFQVGRPEVTDTRGDGALWVYTRMSPVDPAFREAASLFVEQHRPDGDANYDDMAVYFTDSLRTATSGEERPALATLCLYEDGTPDAWHEGRGDCFSDHVSFTEHLNIRLAELSGSLPTEVAMYLLVTEFCTGLSLPDDYEGGNSRIDFCHKKDAGERRAELVEAYGEDGLRDMLGTLD